MLNKFIFFQLMLLSMFSSCTNNTSATKANSKGSPKALPINCYRYVERKDTIALKLIHVGESITGTLAYYMPQKNTSKGTLQGHMDGDVLFGIFTPFVDSTTPRQIAFKLVKNYFIEGYGETYMENGQMVFKNRNALQFNDRNKLYEFKCQ
jgi:hypothetical protein